MFWTQMVGMNVCQRRDGGDQGSSEQPAGGAQTLHSCGAAGDSKARDGSSQEGIECAILWRWSTTKWCVRGNIVV